MSIQTILSVAAVAAMVAYLLFNAVLMRRF
jgi:hypothetical protein